MQVTVKQVKKLGLDQYKAVVVTEEKVTVFETTAMSQQGAISQAMQWMNKHSK
jgi:hypothetical protein